MILIKGLDVSYGREKKVLDGLDLSLPINAIHGIVGLNGSGKTTLLNTIYGLKKADAGEIVNGEDQTRLTKKHIAYLVNENYFYSNITGREYLSLFKNGSFDVDQWNALFSLPLDEVVDGYSTGMKKKLALLGTLRQNKPIIILDEPFNGLDLESCRIIRSILLRLKEQGKTVIITSHIIETLTNLCDFIHFLEDGNIKFSKTHNEFPAFEKELFDSIEAKNLGVIDELMGDS